MSGSKFDRETAVLRHLTSGPKHGNEFSQSPEHVAWWSLNKSVGGHPALKRCVRQGWVQYAVATVGIDFWQITQAGRNELKRRENEAAA